MKFKTALLRSPWLLAACAAFNSAQALSDTHFAGAGVGVTIPTVLGTNYQTFVRANGVVGELWVDQDEVLGKFLSLHASLTYQPFSIRGQDFATLRQGQALIGLETRTDAYPFFIKPFFGIDVGATYSKLSFIEATSNTSPQAGTAAAIQVRSGFAVPLFNSLSAAFSAPVTLTFSTNKFLVLSALFSLRYGL